ncbi:class III cytochrome C domain protein [Nitrospira sp. KM1]|uniref:cytochrome c3 family protein n=1 Tax=Nitrospira sp. KM1 TaxID=1936990 RepID=UPI0013A76D91|nr:cytochrome c3 family protein [Nitrospira sp. KM1]BCA55961.1 class III cytochrome C domain protein [Nitrospira sp. KM1]
MNRVRTIVIFIVLPIAGMAAAFGTLYSTGSTDLASQDRQPIAFSHAQHAGQLKVSCLYCHRHAAESQTAGIPPVHLCMTCHQRIAPRSEPLRQLAAYWKEQRPIPWVRLQRLPDFVYFTHEMHLTAGFECADCHGAVDRIRTTPRAASYEMGWCLTCHRQQEVSQDCWTCHK